MTAMALFAAFLPEEIAAVEADAGISGGKLAVTMKVLGASGRPIAALVPAEIRIYCRDGRELDGAGFVAAKNGIAGVTLSLDKDSGSSFRIVCRELAGGIEKTIAVK